MKDIECIVIASKESPERLPPILTLAMLVSKHCRRTVLVTSECNEALCNSLNEAGIEVVTIYQDSKKKARGICGKIRSWKNFRETTLRVLKHAGPKAILWIGSGDSALALGKSIAVQPYILQLHELYDAHPIYNRMLRYFAQNASCVIVPEYSRAAILRSWYELPKTPYVLPNKPYFHPRTRNVPVTDADARRVLDELDANTKIVLYQGHISVIRDVRPIAAAVNKLGTSWRFVVMGPNHSGGPNRSGFVDEIKKVCPNLLHVPFVPPPQHLEFTSHAYIGVATYDFSCLNHVFCAPNKIWEYAGFGIPILCADIPGLRFTVQTAGAGKCSELTDITEIAKCLYEIDDNYSLYCKSSTKLYDSVDLETSVEVILDGLSYR